MSTEIRTRQLDTGKDEDTQQEPLVKRLLLSAGVIGPLLFIVVFLIEGALRPGYNAWHHPVSTLSLGTGGGIQVANFLITGALLLAFAAGLRWALAGGRGSLWAPLLLGVSGLSVLLAGVFSTDPSLGYPPGVQEASTAHGALHLLMSNLSLLSLTAAFAVLARRFWVEPGWRGWALLLLAAGSLSFVFAIAASLVMSPSPHSLFGLYQRLSIITSWVVLAALACRLATKNLRIR